MLQQRHVLDVTRVLQNKDRIIRSPSSRPASDCNLAYVAFFLLHADGAAPALMAASSISCLLRLGT